MTRCTEIICHPEAFVEGWNSYISQRPGFNYAHNPYTAYSPEANAWKAGASACMSAETVEHMADNPPKSQKPTPELIGGWFALGYFAGVITLLLI
ncbi:hypothetical protein J3366_04065 [Tritonibacter mobilis]|uniref:hypothetical protein n=1 Tax=Tritonibacter mobilis TaxID=379347 RepID=UPI003BAA39C0